LAGTLISVIIWHYLLYGGTSLLAYLVQGLALGLPAAAQPGPFQAYLLSQTMKNGWRKTLPAALAPLLSDGPIIVLVVLILTALPTWFLRAVRVAGGLFMLYLAWSAYRAWRTADFSAPPAGVNETQQSLLEAAVMNLLNPNPYIFWGLAAGPILLQGWRRSAAHGASFLLGFYGTLIGGLALFIVLSATARRLGPQVSRTLTAISAVALFIFALYQLGQGLLVGA
jgi:threonine/homoserine/homoserine lactone efflux protein